MLVIQTNTETKKKTRYKYCEYDEQISQDVKEDVSHLLVDDTVDKIETKTEEIITSDYDIYHDAIPEIPLLSSIKLTADDKEFWVNMYNGNNELDREYIINWLIITEGLSDEPENYGIAVNMLYKAKADKFIKVFSNEQNNTYLLVD